MEYSRLAFVTLVSPITVGNYERTNSKPHAIIYLMNWSLQIRKFILSSFIETTGIYETTKLIVLLFTLTISIEGVIRVLSWWSSIDEYQGWPFGSIFVIAYKGYKLRRWNNKIITWFKEWKDNYICTQCNTYIGMCVVSITLTITRVKVQ